MPVGCTFELGVDASVGAVVGANGKVRLWGMYAECEVHAFVRGACFRAACVFGRCFALCSFSLGISKKHLGKGPNLGRSVGNVRQRVAVYLEAAEFCFGCGVIESDKKGTGQSGEMGGMRCEGA